MFKKILLAILFMHLPLMTAGCCYTLKETLTSAEGASFIGTPLFLPNGCLAVSNVNGISTFPLTPDCTFGAPHFLATPTNDTSFLALAFLGSPCNVLLQGVHSGGAPRLNTFTSDNNCVLSEATSTEVRDDIKRIAISPDKTCLATLDNSGFLDLYCIKNTTTPCTVMHCDSKLVGSGVFSNLGFASNNCLVVTGTVGGKTLLFPITTQPTCAFTSANPIDITPVGAVDTGALAFSPINAPNSQRFALTDNASIPHLYMFTLDTSTCTAVLTQTVTLTQSSPAAAAFSSDGTCLALANRGRSVSIFSVNSDCTVSPTASTIFPLTNPGLGVAFTPAASPCNLLAVTLAGTNQVQIFQQVSVAITPANPTICTTDSVELTANITGGNSDSFTFEWSNGGGTGATATFSGASLGVGMHTITVTVTDTTTKCQTTASTTITVVECPPLTITKKCCKKNKCVTFAITVTNNGNSATNAIVTDLLDSCLIFKKASGNGWQFTSDGQLVTARLASIAPGESSTFTITTKAQCCPCKVTNNASVISSSSASTSTASCSFWN